LNAKTEWRGSQNQTADSSPQWRASQNGSVQGGKGGSSYRSFNPQRNYGSAPRPYTSNAHPGNLYNSSVPTLPGQYPNSMQSRVGMSASNAGPRVGHSQYPGNQQYGPVHQQQYGLVQQYGARSQYGTNDQYGPRQQYGAEYFPPHSDTARRSQTVNPNWRRPVSQMYSGADGGNWRSHASGTGWPQGTSQNAPGPAVGNGSWRDAKAVATWEGRMTTTTWESKVTAAASWDNVRPPQPLGYSVPPAQSVPPPSFAPPRDPSWVHDPNNIKPPAAATAHDEHQSTTGTRDQSERPSITSSSGSTPMSSTPSFATVTSTQSWRESPVFRTAASGPSRVLKFGASNGLQQTSANFSSNLSVVGNQVSKGDAEWEPMTNAQRGFSRGKLRRLRRRAREAALRDAALRETTLEDGPVLKRDHSLDGVEEDDMEFFSHDDGSHGTGSQDAKDREEDSTGASRSKPAEQPKVVNYSLLSVAPNEKLNDKLVPPSRQEPSEKLNDKLLPASLQDDKVQPMSRHSSDTGSTTEPRSEPRSELSSATSEEVLNSRGVLCLSNALKSLDERGAEKPSVAQKQGTPVERNSYRPMQKGVAGNQRWSYYPENVQYQ